MFRCAAALVAGLFVAGSASAQPPKPDEAAFRSPYKELVETNTTLSAGSCTLAAERMAARMKAAGFSDSELTIFTVPGLPLDGGLVAVLPGKDPGPRQFYCWPTSTLWRPSGKTGPAIPLS